MRRKGLFTMLVAGISLLAEVAVADPVPSHSTACPSINSIKNATEPFSVSKRQDESQGKYDVTQTSQYGTQQTWILTIPGIDYMYSYEIQTENEALEFAKTAIKNIIPVPMSTGMSGWINNHETCRFTFQYDRSPQFLPVQANLVLVNNV